jgi:hypothetical protein
VNPATRVPSRSKKAPISGTCGLAWTSATEPGSRTVRGIGFRAGRPSDGVLSAGFSIGRRPLRFIRGLRRERRWRRAPVIRSAKCQHLVEAVQQALREQAAVGDRGPVVAGCHREGSPYGDHICPLEDPGLLERGRLFCPGLTPIAAQLGDWLVWTDGRGRRIPVVRLAVRSGWRRAIRRGLGHGATISANSWRGLSPARRLPRTPRTPPPGAPMPR